MKTAVRNPFHRLIAVATMVALFAAIILAVVFLGSAPARASAPGPVSKGLITPPAPPPLNPPIQTPEPGGAVMVQSGSRLGVSAVPFEPKVYLGPGQSKPVAASGEKPANPPHAQHEVGAQAVHTPPDYSKEFVSAQGWNLLLYEDFEICDLPSPITCPGWSLHDNSPDGLDRLWDDTSVAPFYPSPPSMYDGSWAAWPAGGGANPVNPSLGYPNNLDSWMVYGPVDFSADTDAFVGFGLWYDTEPTYDWVYFCVSTDPNAAADPGTAFWSCDYWNGWSAGWLDQSYWLTSFAGYSSVTFGWQFYSDFSVGGDYGYYGAYIDGIQIWADDTPPPPPPTPEPGGQPIQNGSFEDNGGSLPPWNSVSVASLGTTGGEAPARPAASALGNSDGDVGVATVGVYTYTYVEGGHAAALFNSGTGSDFLYQTFNMTPGVSSVVIDYWFAMFSAETTRGRDYFCASLRDNDGNPIQNSTILVDLGCIDALDTYGGWQESTFTLSASQIATLTGASPPVMLMFEMYNTGGLGTDTTLWVDYVRLYATGAGAGTAIDPYEPNNDLASATTGQLTCSTPVTATIGDALGGYDIDWFQLSSVPSGPLQLDINAQSLRDPRSTLDSILRLYDVNGVQVAYNDDSGGELDSFISYTVPSTGNYFVSVESFTGVGGPGAYYRLTAQCNSNSAPPEGGNVAAPPPDTWTVMLYLNGEDPDFAQILTNYRVAIQGFIGNKQPWLKVLIQFDGPNNGDTVRYLVQPGGYTVGTNQWNMGELNMGETETLRDFVDWAMTHYPAENYYLAIDDHGDGAYGISQDTDPAPTNKPILTPPELYSALKDATQNGARKIDIVDFEACLMGLTENAYDIREWADYVVFSQQVSWGLTTYPAYFSDLQPADTPLTVGQRIVGRYSAAALAEHLPHTISLIDTSKLDALRTAVDSFADALSQNGTGDAARKSLVGAARNASQAFTASNDATNPALAEYIDLWDFAAQAKARGLAAAQATAVQNAVGDAVVAERHYSGGFVIGTTTYNWNHSRAHGLSIYYPVNSGSSAFGDPNGDPNEASYTLAPYLYQMSQGRWDEFLLWVLPSSSTPGGHGRPMNASRVALKDFNLDVATPFVSIPLYLPLILR